MSFDDRTVDVTAADGQPIGAWLSFPAPDRVVLRCGKVDLGTGVRTALAQIAAEELGVDASMVEVVAGHTDVTPDEGYTAGSRTVREGGAAVRRASAAARELLLSRAAAAAGVEPEDCEARPEGIVVGDRVVPRDEIATPAAMDTRIDPGVPLWPRERYRTVGTATPRPEILAKVTGAASFVTDVRIPGMRHGRVVRPPAFGCALLEVDPASVGADVDVVRDGDFLGVVADTEAAAVAAAASLTTRWGDPLPLPPHEQLYAWMLEQPADEHVVRDAGEVPSAAPQQRFERTYHWPFQAHASIGPSCAVADVRPEGVTVWAAAQGVYQLRAGLAALLDVAAETIEVIHREGSGCYGHNGADDVAADAALLSRAVGAPVRVQWSRRDEFVWARKGPAMVMQRSVDLDATGRVSAWRGGTWTPTHGGRARDPLRFVAGHLRAGVPEPDDVNHVGGDRNAAVDYVVGRQRVVLHRLRHAAIPASSFRALGAAGNTFANEVVMDEAAAGCGQDPVAFRLAHLEDPRGRAVLTAAAEAAGWGGELPEGAGQGVAYARYENQGAYLALVADVVVDAAAPAVRVTRLTLAQDCGLVINPDGLRQQLEGNLIQALSRTLLEEVRWDRDRLSTRDWESYPILRFDEIPQLRIVLLEPPGAPPEGAGEPATIVVAPAVANAIAAATGHWPREVPFDAPRLRHALGSDRL